MTKSNANAGADEPNYTNRVDGQRYTRAICGGGPNTGGTPPIINPRVGIQPPQTSYTTCEHSFHDEEARQIVHCTNRAIMSPGYHRACPEHIVPMLRRSLEEYTSRDAAAHEAPSNMVHLRNLIKKLGDICGASTSPS